MTTVYSRSEDEWHGFAYDFKPFTGYIMIIMSNRLRLHNVILYILAALDIESI